MSGLRSMHANFLIDPSGMPVGVVGRDDREWLFPAAIAAGVVADSRVVEGRLLYDATDKPVGFRANGREFIFAAPFTQNTVHGYRARKHALTVNAAGVPCGIDDVVGMVTALFPILPVENGSSGGGGAAPAITTAPVITSAVAGSAPTYSNAASTSTPTPTIAYVLTKNGTGNVVATGASAIASYTSTVAGDVLAIGATPTNANGTGATVFSANYNVTSAGGAAPAVVTAPQINQYAAVGQPISFVRGTYTGTVTGYTQQWLKAGVPISGATGLTYTPASGDNPSNISVLETALNGASASANNISNGTTFATTGVFIGDSITIYTGASVQANAWTSLYCASLGLTQLNKGVAGTVLQNSTLDNAAPGVPQTGNGFDRFAADIQGGNNRQRIVISYGFNDARGAFGVGPSNQGTGLTLVAYKAQFQRMVAGLICNGVRPLDIHIVSPYWMTDAGLNSGSGGFNEQTNLGSLAAARANHIAFAQAATDVATEYGTLYTDGYAALQGVGAGGVGGDNIHPNDTGHAGIAAQAVLGAPNNTKPVPTGVTAARNGAGAMLVSWGAATPPTGRTITNYTVEYGLKSAIAVASRYVMTGTTAASGTSQNFTSLADGWYVARVRANYDDSTSSPWAWFTAGRAIDSRTTDTTVSFTDFSTATPGTNVEATAGWTKLGASTGSLTIGGNGAATVGFNSPNVMGGTVANQTDYYSGASQDFPGSGKLFNEQVWTYNSTASGNANTCVLLKSNSASSANGIMALYNDSLMRVFKMTAGAQAAATGTTSASIAMIPNMDHLVRLEISSGAQTVYVNNVAVATATEPNGGAWGNEAGFRMQNTSFVNTDFTGTHIKSVRVGTTV